MIESISYLSTGYLQGMGGWIIALAACFICLLKLRSRWQARAARKRLVHALLSLWMVLAMLTGIELYFAVFYDQTDSFNMTNISKKWYRRHIDSQRRILAFDDGQGVYYRDDRDFPAEIGTEQQHVLFVGDSFTFGHGVTDVGKRFSNRVRAEFERQEPGRIVVSNLANPGTDLHWIEALLTSLLQDGYSIDTVVYVICLNDIETFHPRHQSHYQDFGGPGPSFFLFRDTYFFNFLYFRSRQFSRPEVRSYYDFLAEYYEGEPWERMRSKLDEVRRLCDANGVGLRIAIFPFLHNLGPAYEFDAAHQVVLEFCKEHGVPAIDLKPHLEPHRDEGLTVNPFDAHPNERAHELAAEAIRQELLGDLVPED